MKEIAASSLFALAIGLTFAPGSAHSAPILPDFGAATFVPGAPIDNPFFPILDTKTRVFVGREDGDIVERFELTNWGPGPTILGVQTTARRDRSFEAFEAGLLLVENTVDFFAQDTAGNVWYFGEDVINLIRDDAGNLITTNNEGMWRAGINGALPGFIMPVDLTVGFNYGSPAESVGEEGGVNRR